MRMDPVYVWKEREGPDSGRVQEEEEEEEEEVEVEVSPHVDVRGVVAVGEVVEHARLVQIDQASHVIQNLLVFGEAFVGGNLELA